MSSRIRARGFDRELAQLLFEGREKSGKSQKRAAGREGGKKSS